MKKFLIILVVSLLLAVLINFIVGPILATQILNARAGQSLQAGSFGVKYGNAQVGRLVPPVLVVNKIQVSDALGFIQIDIPSVKFSTEWQWDSKLNRPKLKVLLKVAGLSVRLYSKEEGAEPAPKASPQASTRTGPLIPDWLAKLPIKLAARFDLFKGSVDLRNSQDQSLFQLDEFDLSVSSEDLINPSQWIELAIKGFLKAPVGKKHRAKLPLEVEASQIQVTYPKISASEVGVSLGGIKSVITGVSELSSLEHNWELVVGIDSLQDLPIPPQFLPPGRWFGGLRGRVQVYKKGEAPPTVLTNFQTKGFGGDIALQKDDLTVSGRVLSTLSWYVKYQNNQLEADDVQIAIDANQLAVSYPPYLKKTNQQKFKVDVGGSIKKGILRMQSKSIELDRIRMKLDVSMPIAPGQPGRVIANIPETSLEGLEKLFPLLSQQPMKGKLALSANATGDFSRGIEGISVSVNPLKVQNLSTQFNLRDDKNKIYAIGPVAGNLDGVFKARGAQLTSAKINLFFDLTRMELDYQGQFQKKMGEPLKANIKVGKVKNSLSIDPGTNVQWGKAKVSTSGKVSNLALPKLDLAFKVSSFNPGRLDKHPSWPKELKLNGYINGDLRVKGVFDRQRGIDKSDLTVESKNLSANFTNLEYVSLAPPAANTEVTEEAPVPKLNKVPSFLPPWPLFQNANVKLSSSIQRFRFNDIRANGFGARAHVVKGGAVVSAAISSIFEGSVKLKRLQVPLIWENPVVRTSSTFDKINVKSVISDLKLEGMPDIAGLASGALKVDTEMPNSKRFLSDMVATGAFNLAKFELKEIELTDSIYKSAKKIPGLNLQQKNRVKGFKGSSKVAFAMKKEVAKFSALNMKSYQNDELNLKGDIKLSGPVNLSGNIALGSAVMGGDVYDCNKDKSGRLIVPVEVKSNWMDPAFNVPKGALKTFASRTLNCQKKKLEKSVKNKVKKEAKKFLENELKDKVKDLFK